jgi:hypothetical protein
VVADIHSGSGGCVGDMIEGDMQAGMHSWRNVGNSIVSVVHVVAIEPIADGDTADSSPALRSRDERRSDPVTVASSPDQNNSRKPS